MKLPETLHFTRPGWWILHLVAIAAVFGAGFVLRAHLAGHGDHAGGSPRAEHHAGHGGAAHQDHTAPEVLRPLMRRMLTDAVQLQGALSAGDLARAAKHADAIAGACDDGAGEPHGGLPASLGPSFTERDRALHGSATRLGAALRSTRRAEAVAANRAMVGACQACHQQAPAARGVDLRALVSFAEGIGAAQAGGR